MAPLLHGSARSSAAFFARAARRGIVFAVGLAVLVAATGALAGLGGEAWATPFDPAGRDWEGLSELVALAQAEVGPSRLVLERTIDLGALRPADAVVLVHPTGPLDVGELSAFMRAGGRVVLLDDYGTGDQLLAECGIRRVPLPAHPAEMLRGNQALPIAEPTGDHRAMRDVGKVVVNHGTGVEQRALGPLLVVRGDGEPDVLLGVAASVGRGRFIAVGDGSVVMNSMMRYPGNRSLARALLRYATADVDDRAQGGVLHLAVNDVRTVGSFRGDSPVGGAERALTDAATSFARDGLPPTAAYLMALAVGLGVVAWTTVNAGRPHRVAVPHFVRRGAAVAEGGVAGRAAMLGAPGTSRVLALLEVKSALEEDVAARLDLERLPAPDDLARKARAAGLLDEAQAYELGRLLTMLATVEAAFAARRERTGAEAWWSRPRDREVRAVADRARALHEALAAAHPPT